MYNLIVGLVVIGVMLYLVNLIPMQPVIKQIINVLAILFIVLWLLQGFGVITHLPSFRLR